MGVRDRLAQLAKVFGPTEPPAMAAGEAAAGMTPSRPFSPGEPIGPYDGFSRHPRAQDFVGGYNISARPRSHERVSFDTLRGLINSYDVAQICISHRIDSIRSLDWKLIAAENYTGDVTDAIAIGMKALRRPDRVNSFETWFAKWMYDVLAFDAGALYRLRNRRGDAIGLLPVDGTLIAPLLDYWGNSPEPPAEAYVQYVQGLPWNWLTRNDLIYEPFRPRTNSPYGHAPLETILLNANTDLRFQTYFLQRFTEGNIPEAFASAPETWSPDQIEQWQVLWDSFMAGDQAAKHTIKWLPSGSTIAWSNEKDFTDTFSLFLMRKTTAAYHVVPSDLGFTETVNLSSSESQGDVQHRIGDLPLIRYTQRIISSFLQDDLGLPLRFAFDLGEEQEDRLQLAQADDLYIKNGSISSSEIREMRFGLPEPAGMVVPRFIDSSRSGPIPLSALYGVAGPIDPQTAAPAPGAPLPHTVFAGVEGTQPNPPIVNQPLAEQIYGPSAIPPGAEPVGVGKEAAPAAPTSGITSQTGITGYDLIGHHDDDEDDEEERRELVKAELAAFRSFRKARQRQGKWRDFEFRNIDPVRGRRLNQNGRLAIRKAAGEIAVAGLAVQAADTGRVLMLQRALDPDDPAGGMYEFPGGHLEEGESPLTAACREWSEETGLILPFVPETAAPLAFGNGQSWSNGIYQGFVYQVPSEDVLNLSDRDAVTNPDDPDSDQVESIAWWSPDQLSGNPAVRPELLDSIDDVLAALGCQPDDDKAELVKAAASPKGDAPTQGAHWPGWKMDLTVAVYWAPLIATAIAGALTARQAQQTAAAYATQDTQQSKQGNAALTTAALAWLTGQSIDLATPLTPVLTGLVVDAYLIGVASAQAVTDGGQPQVGEWKPGDTDTARAQIEALGATAGLAAILNTIEGIATAVASSRLKDAARALGVGTANGNAPAEVAQAMRDAATDPGRAHAVAITEITRGSGTAALDTYGQQQVAFGRWFTEEDAKVCLVCDANAAAGRVPIGSQYPSGDTAPPAHPNCRCALIPA
jgi:8-oxo-dGTP pyrophosphatase MutT (NUDIX family)